jgi:ABC-2 type transport system permease protein
MKANRKATLIWTASLSALVLLFMAMLPAFTKDVEASKQLIGQLPEALRAAFNIQLATFFTVYGFYGYLLNFAAVAGAIMAMNLGTGVISKEVSGKTADFLHAKPITRNRVVTAKLSAALLAIVFASGVFAVVGYASASIASDVAVEAKTFFLMSLSFFLIQLLFLVLGALFAVLLPRVKSVVSVTLPTVFTFYIIGTLGEVLGQEKVRYLSPFRFFDTSYIISNVSLESRYLVLEAALVVAALVAVYLIYLKRDIRAAA